MTTQIKARLGGSTICWREIAPGYAVASFTAKLHGWADTRRFIVVHETVREDKDSVGRRLLDVPGHTFRIWVTNRTEPPEEFCRDYNQRATFEQRIEELKNDLHVGVFCAKAVDTTEAAFLDTIIAYNLLAVISGARHREGGLEEDLDATSRRPCLRSGAGEGRAQTGAALHAKRRWPRVAPRLD
jgi:hypothetical protein